MHVAMMWQTFTTCALSQWDAMHDGGGKDDARVWKEGWDVDHPLTTTISLQMYGVETPSTSALLALDPRPLCHPYSFHPLSFYDAPHLP